ncbi:MAG: hydroxymethylglutaryl-CoA lyase [Abyssibacter sp.]|uniref:hydroxymethylglutaryl-CoA lyase n=1 Tax=Abyssibacter sp. TaxID=2320200 RepID=UPI00321A815D
MTAGGDAVTLVEMAPRDGLQNEATPLTPDIRIELIQRLASTGLTQIEAGAFVSPKWVPQMAGSDTVLASLQHDAGIRYPVLVPNMKGFEAAQAAGARDVSVFAAASESFSRKNINCSIAESLERFRPVCEAAQAQGLRLRGYVSCVMGCPYEGPVDPEAVLAVSRELFAMGCEEISLGDTIGTGTPAATRHLLALLTQELPVGRLAAHFHDTYGQALANLLVALEAGVRVIDASVAGLGGCPYAKGASGNVGTEDVLYMLNGMGMTTGVDLDAIVDVGAWICEQLGRPPASKAARALAARRQST